MSKEPSLGGLISGSWKNNWALAKESFGYNLLAGFTGNEYDVRDTSPRTYDGATYYNGTRTYSPTPSNNSYNNGYSQSENRVSLEIIREKAQTTAFLHTIGDLRVVAKSDVKDPVKLYDAIKQICNVADDINGKHSGNLDEPIKLNRDIQYEYDDNKFRPDLPSKMTPRQLIMLAATGLTPQQFKHLPKDEQQEVLVQIAPLMELVDGIHSGQITRPVPAAEVVVAADLPERAAFVAEASKVKGADGNPLIDPSKPLTVGQLKTAAQFIETNKGKLQPVDAAKPVNEAALDKATIDLLAKQKITDVTVTQAAPAAADQSKPAAGTAPAAGDNKAPAAGDDKAPSVTIEKGNGHQAKAYSHVKDMPKVDANQVQTYQQLMDGVGLLPRHHADGKWGKETQDAFKTIAQNAGLKPEEMASIDLRDPENPVTKKFIAEAEKEAAANNGATKDTAAQGKPQAQAQGQAQGQAQAQEKPAEPKTAAPAPDKPVATTKTPATTGLDLNATVVVKAPPQPNDLFKKLAFALTSNASALTPSGKPDPTVSQDSILSALNTGNAQEQARVIENNSVIANLKDAKGKTIITKDDKITGNELLGVIGALEAEKAAGNSEHDALRLAVEQYAKAGGLDISSVVKGGQDVKTNSAPTVAIDASLTGAPQQGRG